MGRPVLTALLNNAADEPLLKPTPAPAPVEAVPDPTPAETNPAAETPAEVSPEPEPEPQPAKPKKQARSAKPRRAPKARSAATPADSADAQPAYLRFHRKESRLRFDQLTELNTRARQLNAQKNPDADRITDNTLIRVAVDLLLARADELSGGDEAELRQSLGLEAGK